MNPSLHSTVQALMRENNLLPPSNEEAPTKFIHLLLSVLVLYERVSKMNQPLRLPLDDGASHVHPIILLRECKNQVMALRGTLGMGKETEANISKREGLPLL